MVESADHQRLVKALRDLAPSVRPATGGEWNLEPALRVIDCVLSLHTNYDAVVVPRVKRVERDFPNIRSVNELKEKIACYSSPHEFLKKTLRFNSEKRGVTLAKVACWLAGISGKGTRKEQLANLERWAREALPGDHISLNIRGFALAGFQYLRMLFGANTTKPDVRICKWVAQVVCHPVSPAVAIRLLEKAAAEAGVRLRDADATIWKMLDPKSAKP